MDILSMLVGLGLFIAGWLTGSWAEFRLTKLEVRALRKRIAELETNR